MKLTKEQEKVLESQVKDLVVSASAGSGKTFVVIEKLIGLICDKKIPVEKLLVLTFTKAASNEMKNRLYNAILEKPTSKFLIEQIDSLPLSDISTIDSFCEKIIKRNINKLEIDENFTILDEKASKHLKKLAFTRTFQYFSQNEIDKFEEIYFAFKRNKSSIEECIYCLQDFLASSNNQENLLTNFEKDIFTYNNLAQNFLKAKIQENFIQANNLLINLDENSLNKTAKNIYLKLKDIINQDYTKDFFNLCQEINVKNPLPSFRGKIEEEDKKILMLARDYIKQGITIAENFTFSQKDTQKQAEEGYLIKALIDFYKYYIKLYIGLKNKRDGLDFADIEYFAKKLLEDDEIKKGLQDKYDYIFIDEYQDTNRLQQSILKPISEGGHFVAVGDLKQGIYGFRNARMEIMQEDIANFTTKNDGDALFLTGNFRTDKNILDFVNLIFEKIMTIDSVGIDYVKTSKLKGLRHFEEGKMPAIAVDVVTQTANKEVEKDEIKEERKIYSVKDDVIKTDDKYTNEILAIQNRIEQALDSEIYDAKLEKYRKVTFSDITLLFRNRSTLMKEAYKTLSKKGFPINADIKESLLEDSEIAVIYSLLKLTLNQHDDIPLASVMLSHFGGFSVERLAEIKLQAGSSLSFYEIIENNTDEDILEFRNKINQIRFEIQVFGITKALNRLFNNHEYFNYLYSLSDGREKLSNINSLFKLIRSGNLDNNVSGVISQLEGTLEISGGVGGNAITMTTIHATKGLEYPIVILCGAGDSLSKPYTKSFVISEKFGLASYLNDFDNLVRMPSPAFLAGKIEKNKREFIDEIMIFYVAMTRAQNHLFIIGSGKEKDFSYENLNIQNSYLKMIFYALGENLTSQIFSQGKLEKSKWEFNVFDEFEESHFNIKEITESNDKFKKEIEEYNNFSYANKEICKLSFKNSVTGAIKLNDSQEIIAHKTEDYGKSLNSLVAINRGNAYHEALKILDFDKINSLDDLKLQLEENKDMMTEGYVDLIDAQILLKNILLVKELTKGSKLFKEKEFIMQASINELDFTNLDDNIKIKLENSEDKVIVQGIVDLFAVGDEITLIDYKFSSLNEEILKERYCKQIQLYSMALEKAFDKKIKKRYLLSLKDAKVIKI